MNEAGPRCRSPPAPVVRPLPPGTVPLACVLPPLPRALASSPLRLTTRRPGSKEEYQYPMAKPPSPGPADGTPRCHRSKFSPAAALGLPVAARAAPVLRLATPPSPLATSPQPPGRPPGTPQRRRPPPLTVPLFPALEANPESGTPTPPVLICSVRKFFQFFGPEAHPPRWDPAQLRSGNASTEGVTGARLGQRSIYDLLIDSWILGYLSQIDRR